MNESLLLSYVKSSLARSMGAPLAFGGLVVVVFGARAEAIISHEAVNAAPSWAGRVHHGTANWRKLLRGPPLLYDGQPQDTLLSLPLFRLQGERLGMIGLSECNAILHHSVG